MSFTKSSFPPSSFMLVCSKPQSLGLFSSHTHFLSDLIQPLALNTICMPITPTFITRAQTFFPDLQIYISNNLQPFPSWWWQFSNSSGFFFFPFFLTHYIQSIATPMGSTHKCHPKSDYFSSLPLLQPSPSSIAYLLDKWNCVLSGFPLSALAVIWSACNTAVKVIWL